MIFAFHYLINVLYFLSFTEKITNKSFAKEQKKDAFIWSKKKLWKSLPLCLLLHRRRNHCRQSFLFLFLFRFPVTVDQISRRHVATFDLYSSVSSSIFNPQRSGNKFKNPIMFSFYTPASFGSITNVGRWIRFNFSSMSYQIALTSRRSNTKTSPMM